VAVLLFLPPIECLSFHECGPKLYPLPFLMFPSILSARCISIIYWSSLLISWYLLQNICTCDLIHPWAVIPKGHTTWKHLYIYYPTCNKEVISCHLSLLSLLLPLSTAIDYNTLSALSQGEIREGESGRTRCS
jgi:hypothetical protein